MATSGGGRPPTTHGDRSHAARVAPPSRALRLTRRRQRRRDVAGLGAVLAGFLALVVVPGTVGATFAGVTSSAASFTAGRLTPPPAPPENVGASLTCGPATSTLSVSWTGIGWETGFIIDLYKANNNGTRHLVATYKINDPSAVAYTIDMTGMPSGRYLVVVSGTDGTTTLAAAEVAVQKPGSCR